MSYIVKSYRVVINTNQEQQINLQNYQELVGLIETVFHGTHPLPEINNPELRNLLGVKHQSEKLFIEGSPIENRRAAVEYATNLALGILESNEFISHPVYHYHVNLYGQEAVHKAASYKLPLYGIYVCTVLKGELQVIGRTLGYDAEMVEAWREEYREYERNGFEVGGEPFITTSPTFQGEIKLLPDVKDQWGKNFGVN